jgi:hypothetical protein
MNKPTDRYAADRATVSGGPYVVTATIMAILAQLRRVAWPVQAQEAYTHKHYGVKILGALSEADARAFLAHLQAQPTSNPRWQEGNGHE